jgi:hypothetical protein
MRRDANERLDADEYAERKCQARFTNAVDHAHLRLKIRIWPHVRLHAMSQ